MSWPAVVRATHWVNVLLLSLLWLSGGVLWLEGDAALGWLVHAHALTGFALMTSLLIRIAALFDSEQPRAHWRDMVPLTAGQRAVFRATLRHYLTLGRAPDPDWQGHNPLAGMVYLLLFALLLLQGLLGALIYLQGVDALKSVHGVLALVLLVLASGHVLMVFYHEWRQKGCRISALVHGGNDPP
ncbi:Ni,Fe-hydrogenase I cytochrome b subunit [Sulfurivirga caldicuralii]|uniref:Ni,Fe-hydrogenase I cytochrome b subunit n=1 Tax=Sulfurivirga caldicuralii TaxID=364032 RepID=A0A1N6GUL3_9GAMM|nr:cytochrome b/b6 domain-containing protein [Sulfurivirga caldicuralii]SIO11025.1 Ni,Fe-hydrogenase I cytochrome b subunit [Sulfurivirga caldicuralii]